LRTKKALVALVAAAVATACSAGVVIAGGGGGAADNSNEIKRALDPRKPKNVILLVGDGTGDSELTIGRYYLNGADGAPMAYETLPFTGEYLTWNLKYGPGPDYAPNYVPDSAPTATAWSTGRKTGDARLSQGMSTADTVPGSNRGFTTTFEIMKARGKAVGNVATSELTDATPAAPSSHISRRACQGPADARTLCPTETKTAGGLGSIAEQQIDHRLDVNLGGGRARFEQTLDSSTETVVDYAETKGFQYVTDAAGLDAVRSVRGKPLLGLFNASNMTMQFAPLIAAPTPGSGSPTTRCDEDNRPADEPSLAAMTNKAIELLDHDRDGFFLQVESASIDKRDHASDLCGQIGETLQLDQALRVALAYQRRHPDTLIIQTADHSHTSQIVYDDADTPGFYATVQTADGEPMRVSYGTGKTPSGQGHTGGRVPVAAIGPQASNVMGVRDQTDLFHTLIGRERSWRDRDWDD
jgi:alkaline phosphatase